MVAAIASLVLLKARKEECLNVLKGAALKVWKPYLTLLVILAFVQIYMYSGENIEGNDNMLVVIGKSIASLTGENLALVAPFIGALGSFVAGSATVANLLFTGVLYETALFAGTDSALVVALSGVGAAAGNMIAPHNIISVLAVVGVVGKGAADARVIKRNSIPLVCYLSVLAITAFILLLLQ